MLEDGIGDIGRTLEDGGGPVGAVWRIVVPL